MKRKLLLTLTISLTLLGGMNAYAQNGPGYFETYLEDFEDGEAQGWVPLDGPWAVAANDLVGSGGNWYNMSEGEFMRHSIYEGSDFQDYTVSADIYPVWGNKTGIIFNYQDEDNFYVVEHWANAERIYIRQKVNGLWDLQSGGDPGGYNWEPDSAFWNTAGWDERIDTAVASDWIETAEFYNTMKVKNADGMTSVWFNDVEIFTDIPTNEFTSGKVGIYTNWCPVFVNNFKVQSNATIGVERKQTGTVSLFPNPVTGNQFTIMTRMLTRGILSIDLFDLTGKRVYSSRHPNGGAIVVSTASLNLKGIYLVRVSAGNDIYTSKIIFR